MLSEREENEAFLTSKPGDIYIIFFTDGGEVALDLNGVNSSFSLKWLNIRKGEYVSEDNVQGGKVIRITAPGDLEWLAVLSF